jgi:hypothetical protein
MVYWQRAQARVLRPRVLHTLPHPRGINNYLHQAEPIHDGLEQDLKILIVLYGDDSLPLIYASLSLKAFNSIHSMLFVCFWTGFNTNHTNWFRLYLRILIPRTKTINCLLQCKRYYACSIVKNKGRSVSQVCH